jgi:hypothetical protein
MYAAFDPKITWHVPGHGPLSGDYTGLEAIGDFFQRTMEASGDTFSMDVHNVLADDDVVVVLVAVNAQRDGISASFPEVHVWRMKNGKAIEFREYQGIGSGLILAEQLGDGDGKLTLQEFQAAHERIFRRWIPTTMAPYPGGNTDFHAR